MSCRKLARKFHISKSYVSRILKEEGINYLRRRNGPKYHGSQLERGKKACRILWEHYFPGQSGTKMVMDDESYFGLNQSNLPTNNGFYAEKGTLRSDIQPDVSFARWEKFAPKLLVWVAISEEGLSEPFFVPAKNAVNAEIYQNFCIKERLVPFLDEYHADGAYWFWPDLASSHYARSTLEVFEEEKIAYIPKAVNPPNAPQIRPIETSWAILKGRVYENDWSAKNFACLRRRIREKLKGFDHKFCQRLFRHVRQKIRLASEVGLDRISQS